MRFDMEGILYFACCFLFIIALNPVQNQEGQQFYPYSRQRRQSCGNKFQCASGQCVDSTTPCDGTKDCTDGSDETTQQCSKTRCPPYAFQCSYGACVDGSVKCDGKEDCADGSDEKLPSCPKKPSTSSNGCKRGEFQCRNGKCIDDTLLCDGALDCNDGSDETFDQCNKVRCPPFSFRCSYGGCVDGKARCNGIPQCADSSDEDPVICGNEKPICKLPQKPEHGSYKVLNCKETDTSAFCLGIPGTVAPDWTFLEFKCDDGYSLTGSSSNPCANGKWTNSHPNCVPVTCPPLESSNLNINCRFLGQVVPCGKAMAPGTEADIECKVAYQLTFEPGYKKIICQEDGKWDKPLFTCTQECGKRNPEGKPFVSNGVEAKVGEFPWHVGIYQMAENGSLTQICGGSLVNPEIVVSAAHCFWDEAFSKPMDKKLFRVAAGKFYRDWNANDTEIQERELSDILVHDNYKGRRRHFSSDIALLKLNVSVELTWAVLPVCVDWRNEFERFQFTNGNLGVTVGWGVTENNEPSKQLITTSLPFVDFQTCWATIPETFQSYVTADKFCAGYLNGTSVCPGDSGGGIAFEREKKFYLRGIVSVGLEPQGNSKCFKDQYTAFTKVSDYLPWMEDYIR